MRSSQWVAIVLILVFAFVLINWVKGDETFHIAQVFPILGGHAPGIYDFGAAVLILYTVQRIWKMMQNGDGGSAAEQGPEFVEEDHRGEDEEDAEVDEE